MSKLINVLLLASLVSGCARPPSTSVATPSVDREALVGIWAMRPLKNGIANVVEFRADGQALLHPFNCETPDVKEAVEVSHYEVNARENTLRLTSPGYDNTLNIKHLAARNLIMEQPIIDDEKLTFSYIKMGKVVPLCFLYVTKAKDANKETAFKKSDFIPASDIPAHPERHKYIGKWQLKNVTQLEIVEGQNGTVYLYEAPSENWKHLFNSVRWVGNSLHFNSYAYSEKPSLFDHPYHKHLIPNEITLLPNDKLRVTIDLDGDKSDMEFTRE